MVNAHIVTELNRRRVLRSSQESETIRVSQNLTSYTDLRHTLSNLPLTWYPDLIRALVTEAYRLNVFVRPHGCSTLVKGIEENVQG